MPDKPFAHKQAKEPWNSKFKAIFDSIPDAVMFADIERRIIINNPAVHKMFGYTDEELIGQTTEILYADKKDFVEQGRRRYRTGPTAEITPYEVKYRHKNGTVFWTETLGTQVKDVDGNFIGFLGMFRHITARKRAEELLIEEKERYRLLSDLVNDWAWSISVLPDGSAKWEWVSDSMKKITGYYKEDISLIDGWFALIHSDHVAGVKERFASLLSNREILNIESEYKFKKSNGEYIWLHVNTQAIWDDKENRVIRILGATKDITKRKQSEASFKLLAEESPNMIFINARGRIVFANKACEDQAGYKRDELYADDFDFMRTIAPESKRLVRQKYLQHQKGEEITPYEFRLITKDKRILTVIHSSRIIEFKGEKSILGIMTDITERKQANDALKESENKFRQAFENAALGISIVGLKGQFIQVNHYLCQMLGYSEAELLSMTFSDVTHPDDMQIGLDKMRLMLSGEIKSAWFEKRYVHKLGQTLWVMLSTSLLHDESGRPLYFVTQTQDITKRQQAEEKIKASEKELSAILNSLQDIYFQIDKTGKLIRLSPSVQELLGYAPQQLLGTKLSDLYLRPLEYESFLKELTTQDGTVQNFEVQLKRKDGSKVWVSTNAHYLRDKRGTTTGVEGISRDISQLKSAEDMRSRFGRILDNSANEIYIFNAETFCFTQVNLGARRNLGYSMEELNELTPLDIKPDFTQESFAELLKPLRQEKEEQLIFQTRHLRKDGSFYPVEVHLQLSSNESPPAFVAIILDITERKKIEERLQYMAHHDALTALPNRVLFTDRLGQSLAHAERHDRLVAVLFLDLDRFKFINDTMGHDLGDRALQTLAERLNECVRAGDTVARLGGDEFAIVLEDIASADDVVPISRKILSVLSRSFMLDEREFFVTTSIGISLFPMDGKDTQTLLKHADIAMYRSKDQGRNTYQFYSSDMSARTFERLSMETNLRHALEREEYVLYYQAQLDLLSGRVTGVETLLRWQHPELGLIMPGKFIPILEDTGLIIPVGEWVLHQACLQARAWNETELKPLRMAVNLSSLQFNEPNFIDMIVRVLKETGLDPTLLELEITESILMQNVSSTITTLNAISDMGIRLAVDDFGTGYSSLNHLKRFPINTLKIDQEFIHDIMKDPDDATIVEAIIALGRVLHLHIIAEGVESEAQVDFLKSHNCDSMQGYLLNLPQAAKDMEKMLHGK